MGFNRPKTVQQFLLFMYSFLKVKLGTSTGSNLNVRLSSPHNHVHVISVNMKPAKSIFFNTQTHFQQA